MRTGKPKSRYFENDPMSVQSFSFVFMILSVSAIFVFVFPAFSESSQEFASTAIGSAEESMISAYDAVLETEKTGENVSGLSARLNEAGTFLAAARMSYNNEDFDNATRFANSSRNIGEEVRNDAIRLKDWSLTEGLQRMQFTMIASFVGVVSVALGSHLVWRFLKKRYCNSNFRRRGSGCGFLMNVEAYRGWFAAGSLALMLAAASPTLALFIRVPSGSERFSELWLLGPSHMAEDYPFNVRANETYSVYVGVGNHLGYSSFYRVYVKFRNETQPLPDASNSTPSSLSELYEFDFVVPENQVWEELLDFTFHIAAHSNDFVTVESLLINDVTFMVNGTALWNVEREGFFYQLFFELWLFNNMSQNFEYHNRFVSLWLNMTT